MSGRRCVLTFHRVVASCDHDHDVSWDSFRGLMDQLSGASVTTDLTLGSDGSATVLTFDDGTADHRQVGEELAARGLPGVFFVSAGKLGESGYLDEHDLDALCSLGHVIGAHGYGHVRLERLGPDALRYEVADARERLEAVVGRDVLYFAPPGGSQHPRLPTELERSGYAASRTMRWGIHHRDVERFNIPCVPVTELTIARGWIRAALERYRLPWTMHAAYAAKELVPARARSQLRRRTHRRVAR